MKWLSGFYGWMVEHKDGLLVFAAITSPLISAFAVITGPFVQRRIAEQNTKLNREQFGFQQKQAQASFYGPYNQKWADRFAEKAAQLIVNAGKIQTIRAAKSSATGVSSQDYEKLERLRDENKILHVEIFIMLEKSKLTDELIEAISNIGELKERDVKMLVPLIDKASMAARQIVNARLSDVKQILE